MSESDDLSFAWALRDVLKAPAVEKTTVALRTSFFNPTDSVPEVADPRTRCANRIIKDSGTVPITLFPMGHGVGPEFLSEALSHGFFPPPLVQKVATEVLGTDVANHEVTRMTVCALSYRVLGIAMAVRAASNGWSLKKIFGFKGPNEAAPEYMEIEVALAHDGSHQTCRIPSTAGMVLDYAPAGESFLLTVEPTWDDGFNISAYTKRGSSIGSVFFAAMKEWAQEANYLRGQKIEATGSLMAIPPTAAEDVILSPGVLEGLVTEVRDRIVRSSLYTKFGLPTKRGILLYGPPGTGKTLAIRALLSSIPVSAIVASPTSVRSAADVANLYDMARSISPTIVIFEDLDAYVTARGDDPGEVTGDAPVRASSPGESRQPLLAELLNQMDGVKSNAGVITIATTNYPERMDRALNNRPGRFDTKIEFPLPASEQMHGILQRCLTKREEMAYGGAPDFVKAAANLLSAAGCCGAHAEEAIIEAGVEAVNRLSTPVMDDGRPLMLTGEDLLAAAQRIVDNKR